MALSRLTARVVRAYAFLIILTTTASALFVGIVEPHPLIAAGVIVVVGLAALMWSPRIAAALTRPTARSLAELTSTVDALAEGAHATWAPEAVQADFVLLRDSLNRLSDELQAADIAHAESMAELGRERDGIASERDDVAAVRDEVTGVRDGLAALLEAIPGGVLVVDADGGVGMANAEARRLLGWEDEAPRSALGVPDLERLVAACHRAGKMQEDDVAFAAEGPHARAAARPLDDGRALVAFYDISSARRVNLARRALLTRTIRELRDADRETDDIDTLATKMVEFASTASPVVELEREPVDVDLVLADVRESWLTRANAQRVVLALEPGDEVPPAMADPQRVREVILALVDNAMRHTPEGGRVALRTATEGGLVHVVVQDTGEGVGEEHVPYLLERFYTANTVPDADRPGLGLANAKAIVEAHDGWIEVHSELGNGTTVEFTLPAA